MDIQTYIKHFIQITIWTPHLHIYKAPSSRVQADADSIEHSNDASNYIVESKITYAQCLQHETGREKTDYGYYR
ncbi:MAG: hypothetical protein LUE99_08780 [Bacteroides sp.]|nr:hypothetical protein [Bacteroides sp.]